MKYTEFTGKTADEAIDLGLKTLGLTREEADIRVLEEGKKKLFGSVKARVEIAPLNDGEEFGEKAENGSENDFAAKVDSEYENDEKAAQIENEDAEEEADRESKINVDAQGRTDGERALEFLNGLFDILRISATAELTKEAEKIEINVTAANTNELIGKRGMMLDAIQTLAGAVANTGRADYKRVVVDCENYRENREVTLQNLALKLAQKAIKYEKKIRLEPMTPYERRIIHAALSDTEGVTTQSEGKEPHRYIVIVPDNVKYPDRPASPAREDRQQRGGYNRDGGNGYRKPYNRDNGGYNRDGGNGYRKPYNRDNGGYNRDGGNGYRKPYNRDNGGYNREDGNGYRKPYNRDNGNSGNGNGFNRDNKPRTSSYGKRPSSADFFGTYLGNSNSKKDDE